MLMSKLCSLGVSGMVRFLTATEAAENANEVVITTMPQGVGYVGGSEILLPGGMEPSLKHHTNPQAITKLGDDDMKCEGCYFQCTCTIEPQVPSNPGDDSGCESYTTPEQMMQADYADRCRSGSGSY